MELSAYESEQTNEILMRNVTPIAAFLQLTAKFSKKNFLQDSSARLRFFNKQWS